MTQLTIFKRRFPYINLKEYPEIKLNIGCGSRNEIGYIGIDIRDCGQEIVWDITEGIPFPDNSVDDIWTSHFLEHLTDDESQNFLRECYRILKTGGTFHSSLPHGNDPTAFYFDHKTFWNEDRIFTIPTISGLEGFEVIENKTITSNKRRAFRELVFLIRKIK